MSGFIPDKSSESILSSFIDYRGDTPATSAENSSESIFYFKFHQIPLGIRPVDIATTVSEVMYKHILSRVKR